MNYGRQVLSQVQLVNSLRIVVLIYLIETKAGNSEEIGETERV